MKKLNKFPTNSSADGDFFIFFFGNKISNNRINQDLSKFDDSPSDVLPADVPKVDGMILDNNDDGNCISDLSSKIDERTEMDRLIRVLTKSQGSSPDRRAYYKHKFEQSKLETNLSTLNFARQLMEVSQGVKCKKLKRKMQKKANKIFDKLLDDVSSASESYNSDSDVE